jgi:hypothetical protein
VNSQATPQARTCRSLSSYPETSPIPHAHHRSQHHTRPPPPVYRPSLPQAAAGFPQRAVEPGGGAPQPRPAGDAADSSGLPPPPWDNGGPDAATHSLGAHGGARGTCRGFLEARWLALCPTVELTKGLQRVVVAFKLM